MKVGDLVRYKSHLLVNKRLFLVVKMKNHWHGLNAHKCIYVYPDPYDPDSDHTEWGNYYFVKDFEVVSESR